MDIVAHTLWTAAGAAVLHRRQPLSPCTVVVTRVLAALPDVIHLLPIASWRLVGDGTFDVLWAHAMAMPGQEPGLPPVVGLLSHHLHCVMHSAPIAGLVTLALWAVRRALWIPPLGWWSHIVIDVFTQSADHYPVPVLYPFTQRGFDGMAWITPWFMVLNYAALVAVAIWLLMSKDRSDRRRARALRDRFESLIGTSFGRPVQRLRSRGDELPHHAGVLVLADVAVEHEWQRRRHEWSLRSDADDLHRIDDGGIPRALLVQRRRAAPMQTQYCPDATETCFRHAMPVALTSGCDTAEDASRAVLWCSQGAARPHVD